MQLDQDPLGPARDLLRFIGAAPSPYHAAAEVALRLERQGFERFEFGDSWQLSPGSRGYTLRGGTVIGFILGRKPPAEAGFTVIGAHTDSPNLRLKPQPEFESTGFRQLSIEIYGGVLLSTWLDRDLGMAGRLALSDGRSVLVRIDEPVCRIPSLAIHLNREVNKDGLLLNPQQHLAPIFGLHKQNLATVLERLARAAAKAVSANDILGLDIGLFDLQPGVIGGEADEFLISARLDNLTSCHAACTAFTGSTGESEKTRLIALYDHEEVGSSSSTGARSQLLSSVLERLIAAEANPGPDALSRALSRSLLVSVDMAHGVHPNYADKHDKQHRPSLGRGPVIKVNQNQSYASDGSSVAAFVRACRAVEVEPQYFAARNDSPCGSTIGPIAAAQLGIATVDVGNPMLAMHSCRETAASSDVAPMIRVLSQLLSAGE